MLKKHLISFKKGRNIIKFILLAQKPAKFHKIRGIQIIKALLYQRNSSLILLQESLEGKVGHLGIGIVTTLQLEDIIGKFYHNNVHEFDYCWIFTQNIVTKSLRINDLFFDYLKILLLMGITQRTVKITLKSDDSVKSDFHLF